MLRLHSICFESSLFRFVTTGIRKSAGLHRSAILPRLGSRQRLPALPPDVLMLTFKLAYPTRSRDFQKCLLSECCFVHSPKPSLSQDRSCSLVCSWLCLFRRFC